MAKHKKPSRAELEQRLANLRAGRERSIPPDEVTGLIRLATEELERAADDGHKAVLDAARENQAEAVAAIASTRPPPGDDDDTPVL